jgi:aminoglycoside phosphotransferase (APT) family kinase protein
MHESAATKCAQWLAAFHDGAPLLGPRIEWSDHLLSIAQWYFRVVSLERSLADKSRAVLSALEFASRLVQAKEAVGVHGDYTHHQVIFGESSTITTDWDNHGVAHPARDVARFVVGLQRLAMRSRGSIGALERAGQSFIETYLATSRFDVSAALPFHRAAACLEHVKHDVHKRSQGWRERAERTLDEGLRVLGTGA